ncbi:hypothetical protein [Halomicronema hongdechloris]|uniref:hypothetical protein n=1 Tax=Halomicronema hongdechloris TaxID=1209493 RepID=UPI0010CC2BB4|nr:hypothetical protein [Halomicronema hongdechloris]
MGPATAPLPSIRYRPTHPPNHRLTGSQTIHSLKTQNSKLSPPGKLRHTPSPITPSPHHPITPSPIPHHPITPSPHHPITPSPHHPITPSPLSPSGRLRQHPTTYLPVTLHPSLFTKHHPTISIQATSHTSRGCTKLRS